VVIAGKTAAYRDGKSVDVVFQLDQAALTLAVREFYLLDEGAEEREAYYELMAESVVYLYGRDPVAVRLSMKEVLQFEIDLANVSDASPSLWRSVTPLLCNTR